MGEFVTLKCQTEFHYYMADSTTIAPGFIGEDFSPTIPNYRELYIGGCCPILSIPASATIEVTELIRFCRSHKIDVTTENLSMDLESERYKNIFEIVTELKEKNLMSEVKRELPEMYKMITDITEDGDYFYIHLSPNKVNASSITITDVTEIVPEKVVRVTFADGTSEKAVCREPDKFSLETGITICIAKKVLGGSAAYNKAVKQGVKSYERKLAAEKFKAEEEERAKKKREKRNAYKARRAARRKAEQILKDEAEKERQIEIQKQAYIEAMEFMNEKSKENE